MADQGDMPGERLHEPGSHAANEGELGVEETGAKFPAESLSVDKRAYLEDAADAAGAMGSGTDELSSASQESREVAGHTSGWVDVPDTRAGFEPAGTPTLDVAGVAEGSSRAFGWSGSGEGESLLESGESGDSGRGLEGSGEGESLLENGESGQVDEAGWDPAPEPVPGSDDLTTGSQATRAPSGSAEVATGGAEPSSSPGGMLQTTPTGEVQTSGDAALDPNSGAEHLAPDEGGAAEALLELPAKDRDRIHQLEREGEVAADFLERLLDIADLDGDIDVDVDGDRAAVAIVDSDEGRVPRRLVGPDGRVLEALQELTRLAVQTATGERSRLMLDVAGFRAERRATLLQLARTAIAEVKDSGQQKTLPDMTAFERKVVHDEVTAAGLTSESEGVDPHRHIVIMPA